MNIQNESIGGEIIEKNMMGKLMGVGKTVSLRLVFYLKFTVLTKPKVTLLNLTYVCHCMLTFHKYLNGYVKV